MANALRFLQTVQLLSATVTERNLEQPEKLHASSFGVSKKIDEKLMVKKFP